MSPEEQQRRLARAGMTLKVAEKLDGHWREHFGLPYSPYDSVIHLDAHKTLHDAEDQQSIRFGE